MNQYLKNCIRDNFKPLVEEFGFSIKIEIEDDQYYMIRYASDDFGIKLEPYHRGIIPTLYKIEDEDYEINVFALLDYIYRSNPSKPKSEYFYEEKNLNDAYRKQLEHISKVIYDNYNVIVKFFRSENYKSNVIKLSEYLIEKYPDFFRQGPF